MAPTRTGTVHTSDDRPGAVYFRCVQARFIEVCEMALVSGVGTNMRSTAGLLFTPIEATFDATFVSAVQAGPGAWP